MGFLDALKKFAGAVAKEAGEIAKEAGQAVSENKSGASATQQNTAKDSSAQTKKTPSGIISSGNNPAKPSVERKTEFFGGETGDDMFDVRFMLSGDFVEFNSHCEVEPAYQYEPDSTAMENDLYTGYESNLPHIGIGPCDEIYDAVEEFEETGELPDGDFEKCDSEYFAFRCSFDNYGDKYYAYAFRSGTTREKEMLSVDYLPDVVGTSLEKKLKAILDEVASTYSETLSK